MPSGDSVGCLEKLSRPRRILHPDTRLFATSSTDPRDYQLAQFNINPEVFAPTGSRGRLGLSIREVRVEVLAR